jgi:hypothetical protein
MKNDGAKQKLLRGFGGGIGQFRQSDHSFRIKKINNQKKNQERSIRAVSNEPGGETAALRTTTGNARADLF